MTDNMRLTAPPMVKVGMGIHRLPSEVFAAFVEPATTKTVWIDDSTGPLEPEARVTWNFNAYGAQATVIVRRFEPGERLGFDRGSDDQLAGHAADSTGGFTMVLCSLKALLEHDIELGAVTDRLPE